ncbi:uncharacterized protein BXZ73DRAFT_48566 [Epithele typhae]|uniref:uncharacterized protein n=1 Tax=Epithele typhae TaxID=378194 RepID=UPI002007C6B6|nr:uncharacterized protein BXZ73DRAFT_48566 [Epithele typhae]KAH9928015.1 hypothetical protein BXZ73DRAFT_48566 [Epithele typhae]
MAPKPATRTTRSRTFNAKGGSKSFNSKPHVEDGEDSALEDTVEDAFEAQDLDSDALDEDSEDAAPKKRSRKRKRTSLKASPKKAGSRAKSNKEASPRKKRKTEDHSDYESGLDLVEGQEIVGVVVQALKTGRVPPGQVSKNTLDFLAELRKPACNDREWCVMLTPSEPVYRLAESEFKAFVTTFTDLLVEVDPQIPHLPPKDVIHRIYRDVRFSNDKTPYKTGLSASFSRSGRKGIFAVCSASPLRAPSSTIFVSDTPPVKANGESVIAVGSWHPGKNELATMRHNLQRSSRRLRAIISSPDFEALFGPARPHPKGARQSVFGMEDELKVAPKGIGKDHRDIDLLKCRSFAVVHKFADREVLDPGFKEELARIAGVVRPFVHCLNDLMTIRGGDDSDDDDDDGADDGADEQDGEDE